eukprot:CFRG2648T1
MDTAAIGDGEYSPPENNELRSNMQLNDRVSDNDDKDGQNDESAEKSLASGGSKICSTTDTAIYPCVDTARELHAMLCPGNDLMSDYNVPSTPVTVKQMIKGLCYIYWKEVLLGAILFVIQALAMLGTPICIHYLLLWHEGDLGEDRDNWIGYSLLCAFAVLELIAFATLNQMKRVARRAGIGCRSTIQGCLYAQLLVLPMCGQRSPTGGELSALFGADMDAVLHLWSGILGLLFGPLEIFGIIALLFYYVQLAAFGAIGVILVVMCIFRVVGGVMESRTGPHAKTTDDRCHIIHEFLSGTKVVKANAWEDKFASKINEVRAEESKRGRTLWLLMGMLNVAGNNSIDVISLALLSIYTLGMDNILLPSTTFTIWIILSILHGKILHFPGVFDEFMSAWTALKRISSFLSREGIKTGVTTALIDEEEMQDASERISPAHGESHKLPFTNSPISLREATFAWPVAADKMTNGATNAQISKKKSKGDCVRGGKDRDVDVCDDSLDIDKNTLTVSRRTRNNAQIHGPRDQANWNLRRKSSAAELRPQVVRASMSSRYTADGVDENIEAFIDNGVDRCSLNDDKSDSAVDKMVVCLNNLTLHIPDGTLLALVGPVASGKSSLLQSLLGEVPLIHGKRTCVNDRIAYSAQQTWIFQGTIRENILFGESYDVEKYEAVVYACALQSDFDNQPYADLTKVQASSLSGGQKQRIGIARAAYSSARLVLLDDPLSALDYKVASHVFTECFVHLMKDRTVVFTTNFTRLLDRCDLVGVVDNRSVLIDTLENITERGSIPLDIVNHAEAYNEISSGRKNVDDVYVQAYSVLSRLRGDDHADEAVDVQAVRSEYKLTEVRLGLDSIDVGTEVEVENERKVDLFLNMDEEMQHRNEHDNDEESFLARTQEHNVLWHAANGVSGWPWLLFMGLGIGVEVVMVECQLLILSRWSDEGEQGTITHDATTKYILYYGILLIVEFIGAYTRQVLNGIGSTKAADHLHRQLLDMITTVPLSYFQNGVTSPSYVLNLFARDLKSIDRDFFMTLEFLLVPLTYGSALAIAVAIIIPWSILLLVITVVGMVMLLRHHKSSTQRSERLIASTKLPLVECVSLTGEGVATIRAFGRQHSFLKKFGTFVDDSTRASLSAAVAMTTTSTAADVLGCVYNVGVAAFIVIFKNDISSGEAGFMLTNAAFSALTVNLVVYRFLGLTELGATRDKLLFLSSTAPSEAASHIQDTLPPDNWPSKGKVDVQDLVVKYAPHLDPVLKGISFTCEPGEKLGVVGRTGAGKSSLMLGLTRLLELSSGSVSVDEIDVSKLGIRDYRGRLTVISQEPLFFSGSVRQNLDPFNKYTDEEIWRALRQAELADTIQDLPKQLEYYIAELGGNMSIGQLQLLSLARAILQQPTVMLMDEATASLDLMTDRLIQRTIRTLFTTATVIQVAHRIDTVIDSDRILVLDGGLIAEQGSPYELLQDKTGIFYGMVQKSGSDAARLTMMAEAAEKSKRSRNI